MSAIGESLKAAREAKSISLDEAASATRINKKYLQALEDGTPVGQPELYVRAFIKDYSAYLGVELEGSGAQSKPDTSVPQGRIASTVSSQVTTTNLPGSTAIKYPRRKQKGGRQFVTLALITLIVLASFIALLLWSQRDKTSSTSQEVSFTDVVKHWETTQTNVNESPFISGSTDTIAQLDTLILEGAAVESVWVRVVIDGSEIKEYSLSPLGRLRCEGRQFFELSMDNARGIVFTFNGKRIGTLSQVKKPLWNVTVSPTTLEQLQKMAGGRG